MCFNLPSGGSFPLSVFGSEKQKRKFQVFAVVTKFLLLKPDQGKLKLCCPIMSHHRLNSNRN